MRSFQQMERGKVAPWSVCQCCLLPGYDFVQVGNFLSALVYVTKQFPFEIPLMEALKAIIKLKSFRIGQNSLPAPTI